MVSFESCRPFFCPSSSRLPLFPCKHTLLDPVESRYRSAQKACRSDMEERRSAAAYRARDAPSWSWWMFSRAPVQVKRMCAGCAKPPYATLLRKSRESPLYLFWNKFRCERSRFRRFLMNASQREASSFVCLRYFYLPCPFVLFICQCHYD